MNTAQSGGDGPASGGGAPVPSGGAVLREPPMPLSKLCSVLGEMTRWKILRELAKGEPLPVKELARRTGRSSDVAQKHVTMLKEAKIVVQGYGRLYKLAPGIQPDPGAAVLDLGHCVIRLDLQG